MITKKSQTRKGGKVVSLRYLDHLWRLAVLKRWDCTCVICNRKRDPSALECHHVIHRSQSGLLKWHLPNGAVVCKDGCHQAAHRAYGADIVRAKITEAVYQSLVDLDRDTLKAYLSRTGKSRAEWLKEQYLELTSFLKDTNPEEKP